MMPYIKHEDRVQNVPDRDVEISRLEIGILLGKACRNGGDLQYILAVGIKEYLKNNGLNYQKCQDIIGALEGAKLEFYRKVLAPYEEKKIEENGGIY